MNDTDVFLEGGGWARKTPQPQIPYLSSRRRFEVITEYSSLGKDIAHTLFEFFHI